MIWIISGTQDGREIGAKLADREINKSPEKRQEILMTVVSQYGKVLALSLIHISEPTRH